MPTQEEVHAGAERSDTSFFDSGPAGVRAATEAPLFRGRKRRKASAPKGRRGWGRGERRPPFGHADAGQSRHSPRRRCARARRNSPFSLCSRRRRRSSRSRSGYRTKRTARRFRRACSRSPPSTPGRKTGRLIGRSPSAKERDLCPSFAR